MFGSFWCFQGYNLHVIGTIGEFVVYLQGIFVRLRGICEVLYMFESCIDCDDHLDSLTRSSK
jgi:hypothetical protein